VKYQTDTNQCAVCLCDSITQICDDCRTILRRNGIVNINTEEDYKNWREGCDDKALLNRLSKQICDSINY
jgi:ribosomal protein L36